MKKTLTKNTMISLMKDITEWAKAYCLGSDYSFFMTQNKYPNDDNFNKVVVLDIGEEYSKRFFFGIAFDGNIYDAIHCMEDYYESAYHDFFSIIRKYGFSYDFLDSIHLLIYVDE